MLLSLRATHTYASSALLETVEADGVWFTYGSYLGNIARKISVSALNGAGSFTPVPYTTMNKTVATSFGNAFGKVTSIKYGASGTAPVSGAGDKRLVWRGYITARRGGPFSAQSWENHL